MIYWRGRRWDSDEEQVANAHDDFLDLTPATQAPAAATQAAWAAVLPGQETPLIWEERHGDAEE